MIYFHSVCRWFGVEAKPQKLISDQLSILDFPAEIRDKIFALIGPRDFKKIPSLCQQFNSQFKDFTVRWINANRAPFSSLGLSAKQIDQVFQSTSTLRHIDIQHEDLLFRLHKFSRLQSLRLGEKIPHLRSIEEIAKLSTLTQLDLSHCRLLDGNISLLVKLPRLESLSFDKTHLTDKGCETLATMTKLKTLFMHGGNSFTKAPVLTALCNLTELNVQASKMESSDAITLSLFSNLTYLDISFNAIGNSGLEVLTMMTNLQSLKASGLDLNEHGLAPLALLPSLTSLDVSCNKILDQGAMALGSRSLLRELVASYCSISTPGLQAFTQLSRLTALNINGNPIDDGGLIALTVLTRLRSLFAQRNRFITLLAVEAIATTLTNLENLNLKGMRLDLLDYFDKRFEILTRLTKLAEHGSLEICGPEG